MLFGTYFVSIFFTVWVKSLYRYWNLNITKRQGTGKICPLLPNLMPRGGLTLPDFPGLLKSLVSKWRIVRVKTWTKALFFEEILIHFPWENLHKLTCSNERMQYFCNAPKLNLKSRHSASVYATVRRKGCSNQRWSWLYYNTINFRQQRILYPHL